MDDLGVYEIRPFSQNEPEPMLRTMTRVEVRDHCMDEVIREDGDDFRVGSIAPWFRVSGLELIHESLATPLLLMTNRFFSRSSSRN